LSKVIFQQKLSEATLENSYWRETVQLLLLPEILLPGRHPEETFENSHWLRFCTYQPNFGDIYCNLRYHW